jgi:hypothetical protein
VTTISGALRNSITASMGKSGLEDNRAKSTTKLAPTSLLRYWSARSLKAGAMYGTATTPSPSPATGGGDEDAGDNNKGRGTATPTVEPSITEAGEGYRAEEANGACGEHGTKEAK